MYSKHALVQGIFTAECGSTLAFPFFFSFLFVHVAHTTTTARSYDVRIAVLLRRSRKDFCADGDRLAERWQRREHGSRAHRWVSAVRNTQQHVALQCCNCANITLPRTSEIYRRWEVVFSCRPVHRQSSVARYNPTMCLLCVCVRVRACVCACACECVSA